MGNNAGPTGILDAFYGTGKIRPGDPDITGTVPDQEALEGVPAVPGITFVNEKTGKVTTCDRGAAGNRQGTFMGMINTVAIQTTADLDCPAFTDNPDFCDDTLK